ncbi:YaiI/YqxD family protein [Mangrovibrevibacter kandeliae]|uniref:YaiI/YqxD family protein n=1 Tax=Mangrovibrevibacter kandeliae TaxID=2968473 RepID=UPI002118BCBD|nr:YaiI/YqxD family protein [Aurantimonas sp. CSK15Z-1]MCQ8782466.1 YaiI/YqxD family protein [Aurantimonas sp. CSK15Z-1]
MPRIFVDADACPVKDEALEIADRYGAELVLVSNGGIRPSRYPGARIVVVAEGADAADDRIIEEAGPRDVVITADIPLAARALERGATVLGPTGRPFTPETIGTALSMRAFKQHLRETGESKGYNAAFTAADRSRFRQALDLLLRRLADG